MENFINSFITLAYKRRVITMLLGLVLILMGFWAFETLQTEAYPEFTSPMVEIVTTMPGKGAEELERLVTVPLEKQLNGIPGEKTLRSVSLFGLSVIRVFFDDTTVMSLDRQRVIERIAQADIPDGVQPQLTPEIGATSEIYRYTVESRYYNAMSRKAIEDWQLERAFRQIPGVIDVTSFGGPTKTYQVNVDPMRLISHNVTIDQVYQALANSNATTGGNYIEHNGEAYVVRGLGLLKNISDIENVVVTNTQQGVPIRIKDVAKVDLGPGIRLGQFGKNNDDDEVMGIVLMRRGENASEVIDRLYKKFPEIQQALPDGIKLEPLYDRNHLVQETMNTIGHNVIEGISLVMVVLIIFLGDFTSGLITATVIPLALLFAFLCLKLTGISANLLSLGAIDFGIIVDGAVVMVENSYSVLVNPALIDKHARDDRPSRMRLVLESSKQMGKPILFATLIIMMAFVPIYAFQGVAGKLFHPLAFTMNFALLGAVLISLTIIPVLVGFFMTRKSMVNPDKAMGHDGGDSGVIKFIHRLYDPLIRWSLENPVPTITFSLAALAAAIILFTHIGSEFLPPLEEGNIWLRATIIPTSVSLEGAVSTASQIRHIIMKYPEIKNVTSQVGSPDDGTDPNLFSNIECLVDLKPFKDWRPQFHGNKVELISAMNKDLSRIPNVLYNFSQYIQDNVDEAISGAKGNLGIKIYGPDLYTLQQLGDKIGSLINAVPGMVDVADLKQTGQPQYQVVIDRDEADRYGINVSDIQRLVEEAIGGKVATQLIDGEKRFNILVRAEKGFRNSQKALDSLLIDPPGPIGPIPLSQVAHIVVSNGATMINRENNSRLMIIKANVRGRDLGSAVQEAQKKIKSMVKIPSGYQIKWGGQYEYQQESNQRMLFVVPLSIFMIFCLLAFAFRSVSNALLILSAVPLSIIGGIVGLYITHTYFSISAGVGFIALFGVAVQNGVILISNINFLRDHHALSVKEAVYEGTSTRMRPVLMTATVAILGLLPAALSNGIGAQSQKPFAIVIIGGLVSSTFLTLLVLPTLYNIVVKDKKTVAFPVDGETLDVEPV